MDYTRAYPCPLSPERLPLPRCRGAQRWRMADGIGGQLDTMQSRQTKLLRRYLSEKSDKGRAYINP